MKKKFFKVLFLLLVICIITSMAGYQVISANQSQNKSITAPAIQKDGYIILTSDGYLNTTAESCISISSDIKEKGIETISIEYENEFVPVETSINKDILTINPMESLVDGATYTLRIFCSDNSRYQLSLKAYNVKEIDFTKDNYYKIPANPEKGFNYDYYLFVPSGADKSKYKRLMVEPNNTGKVSEVIDFHDDFAKKLVMRQWNGGLGNWASTFMKMPLIVPVFPRPQINNWDTYTHVLDRGTMLIKDGDMKRLDLQLAAMIEDAQKLLKANGLNLESKVFMTGFSASGQFVQRFAIMHPEKVKAIIAQGSSTLPLTTFNGYTINYPMGIADIKQITGKEFNSLEYKKIAQFIYMGDLDRNDGVDDEYKRILGHEVYPTRWNNVTNALKMNGFGNSIQFNVYKGIGHGIPSTAYIDILAFLSANNGDKFTTINAHESNNTNNWDRELDKLIKSFE